MTILNAGRRLLWTLLGSLFLASLAHAQADSHHYAVISLIGDELNVVTFQPSTGSWQDRNARKTYPIQGGVFDKAALLAADGGLKAADDKAKTSLLLLGAPSLFSEQERFFEAGRLVLPEAVEAAVKGTGAGRLLLITKHRGEANLGVKRSNLGSGKVWGLGFYVDHNLALKQLDTGETGEGYVAPYMYVLVSLVDVQTHAVLAQQAVTESHVASALRSKSGMDAWDALTPAEKVGAINGMLSDRLAAVVAALASSGKGR